MHDLAEIRRGLQIAAQIVARDGPDYLPIFLRLEAEERRAARESEVMARAIEMAGAASLTGRRSRQGNQRQGGAAAV